jgi:multisubunit Na+/H+ antiporter MnhC subunit
VVGIAVTALGLAIAIRIKEEYGSIEESDTRWMDREE